MRQRLSRQRLSLTGQLLVLQLAIVVIVVIGVVFVTLARETARFRDLEGNRATAVAETLAASRITRDAIVVPDLRSALDALAEGARSSSGATYAVVADVSGSTVTENAPDLAATGDLPSSPALTQGRAWLGTVDEGGSFSVVAHAPVLADEETVLLGGARVGDVIGVVVVGRSAPTLLGSLAGAAPTLVTYLGVAGLVGVVGSVLVARRVRRQTLGLDPDEIVGLVEHREAVLHAIREGIIALDLRRRVTIANDEALQLLGLPVEAVGQPLDALRLDADVVQALTHTTDRRDQAVPVDGRLLILNSLPVHQRGQRIGSVTTLRDRTELMALQRELDVTQHATDTLRAQAHEFSNRLHTISGLIELEEFTEVVAYVQRLDARNSRFTAEIVERVADPAVAALLIAKGTQADERDVRLIISPDTHLGQIDEALSTDVATVVGNLVDNAFDAVAGVDDDRQVDVQVVDNAAGVRIVIRDNGCGIAPDALDDVFQRGFSTKDPRADTAGQRGIGLSLVRLVCRRRGGTISVHNDGGAVFTATLPAQHDHPSEQPGSFRVDAHPAVAPQ
ncbi:MAG TPA: ATP-binding protein [Actinomycetes bacterium]|nr:ATP-binding protein [Actinomycetes bacterium]